MSGAAEPLSLGAKPAGAGSLLAPRWARAAIGALAATIAMVAVRVLVAPVIQAGPRAAQGGDVIVVFALLVPFLFGAAASVIADLDREKPRYSLALACGIALAIATVITAAISGFAAPLAPAAPIALRAFRMRAPSVYGGRLEHVLEWAFTGAFWPATIALAGGFLIRIGVHAELIYATGASAFGALFTLAMVELDPDRPALDPEAESAPVPDSGWGGERA